MAGFNTKRSLPPESRHARTDSIMEQVLNESSPVLKAGKSLMNSFSSVFQKQARSDTRKFLTVPNIRIIVSRARIRFSRFFCAEGLEFKKLISRVDADSAVTNPIQFIVNV